MNDYTNIKWITIVIPVVVLSIVEFLRLNFLSNTFSITSSIFLLIFFAVGGFTFSQAIFKYIQQKNNELYWERHRLQALFEHTSDGIIVIDENRDVIEINPAAEKMTGWKAHEVIGKIKCCQLNGCFDKATCFESNSQNTCLNHECGHSKCWGLTCFKDKSCIPYVEMCINNRDGIKIPVAASYSYIPAFGDEKPHIKMVVRDISSRKELERAVQTVAVLEERYRISREMHDGLAQDLCLLSLKLKTMKKTMANTDELTRNEFEMMNCIISSALSEVRQTIFDLKVNPQQLACFTSWVRDALKDFTTKNGIITVFECDLNNNIIFPNEVRIQLARIVQESLNNIRKHAQATEIRVKMFKNNNKVHIHIEDNGIGFDIVKNKELKENFGLSIMKERAQLMNGSIKIESELYQGTKIKIVIPCEEVSIKAS